MRLLLASLAALTVLGSVRAEPESLRNNSPFVPPATGPSAPAENQALASIEFTGVLVLGSKPSFSLRDTATNHSFWIDLGQTLEDLTATAYDADTHSVTIEGRGTRRTLALKEARILSAPAAPVAATRTAPATALPPPAPPPRPLTIAEQLPANLTPQQRQQRTAEIEARMMVSDLLEIGQQERARYQDEQRRRGTPPSAPTPAPAPPAQPAPK